MVFNVVSGLSYRHECLRGGVLYRMIWQRSFLRRDKGVMVGLFELETKIKSPCLSSDDENTDDREETVVITRTRSKLKRPSLYRVLLLNDDYTPMDFVQHVLERFFHRSPEDAIRIMLTVHHTGVGECGIYTYEVAETKVTQVMDFSRKNDHPLQCVMEKI